MYHRTKTVQLCYTFEERVILYSDIRTDLAVVICNRLWAEGVRYIFPTDDDHLKFTTCPVCISGLSQQKYFVMLCMITTHYSCYDIKGTDTTLGIINNQFRSCLHEPIFGFVNAYTQVLQHNPYKQHFSSVIYSSHYNETSFTLRNNMMTPNVFTISCTVKLTSRLCYTGHQTKLFSR